MQIPDVVGLSLSQALILLRNAGLESEPHIVFEKSEVQPRNNVLSVTPKMRMYVTPNANVRLNVSDGTKEELNTQSRCLIMPEVPTLTSFTLVDEAGAQ